MNRTQAMLVFGTDEQSELVESLVQLGFLPLIRSKMLNALKLVRHKPFDMVLVDRDNLEGEDALEFILNVRDLDRKVPIILVGEPSNPNEERVVAAQKNTFGIGEPSLYELKNELSGILQDREGSN